MEPKMQTSFGAAIKKAVNMRKEDWSVQKLHQIVSKNEDVQTMVSVDLPSRKGVELVV